MYLARDTDRAFGALTNCCGWGDIASFEEPNHSRIAVCVCNDLPMVVMACDDLVIV